VGYTRSAEFTNLITALYRVIALYNGEYSSDNNPDDPYWIPAAAVHEINWLTVRSVLRLPRDI
jgi:hypothetical protein